MIDCLCKCDLSLFLCVCVSFVFTEFLKFIFLSITEEPIGTVLIQTER